MSKQRKWHVTKGNYSKTRAITVVIRAPHAGQVGMMHKLKMGGKSKHENVLRAITPK